MCEGEIRHELPCHPMKYAGAYTRQRQCIYRDGNLLVAQLLDVTEDESRQGVHQARLRMRELLAKTEKSIAPLAVTVSQIKQYLKVQALGATRKAAPSRRLPHSDRPRHWHSPRWPLHGPHRRGS